jgi:hypothetical protein
MAQAGVDLPKTTLINTENTSIVLETLARDALRIHALSLCLELDSITRITSMFNAHHAVGQLSFYSWFVLLNGVLSVASQPQIFTLNGTINVVANDLLVRAG